MLGIRYLAVTAEVSRFSLATRKLAAAAEMFPAIGNVQSLTC